MVCPNVVTDDRSLGHQESWNQSSKGIDMTEADTCTRVGKFMRRLTASCAGGGLLSRSGWEVHALEEGVEPGVGAEGV